MHPLPSSSAAAQTTATAAADLSTGKASHSGGPADQVRIDTPSTAATDRLSYPSIQATGQTAAAARRSTISNLDRPSNSSMNSGRSDVQPVLLRSPVQPWSNAPAPPSYKRSLPLDHVRRSSSFNDSSSSSSASAKLTSPSNTSQSSVGRTQSSNMLAASRVAPYYHPAAAHLTVQAGNAGPSSSSSMMMMYGAPPGLYQPGMADVGGGGVHNPAGEQANDGARRPSIRDGMTSVSPTRMTFIERHSSRAGGQHRQRTLSDMHPSNFAALHTALAKAVIAAGEEDGSAQNNRKRTQSCDICRIRKVKCVRREDDNGGLHSRCKQCEANDAKCTYAYVPKKPGPQTSASSAAGKSHTRRATEERHQSSKAAAGSIARSSNDAGGNVLQHGIAASQQLGSTDGNQDSHSILHQLSPLHLHNEGQWSMYGAQPMFSPASVHASSDGNPFDHGGEPSSYEARNTGMGFFQQHAIIGGGGGGGDGEQHLHQPNAYNASSVSVAAPTSAMYEQLTGHIVSPTVPSGMEVSSSSYGGRLSRPSSPMASFAMMSSASAPRPNVQSSDSSSHSYASSPHTLSASVSQMGGGSGAGPSALPNHHGQHPFAPHSNQQPSFGFPFAPSSNGGGEYHMPLHSAPPTMTHFNPANIAGGPPSSISGMEAMSMSHGQGGVWPPRNASFSHAAPTALPVYSHSSFTPALDPINWQDNTQAHFQAAPPLPSHPDHNFNFQDPAQNRGQSQWPNPSAENDNGGGGANLWSPMHPPAPPPS